MQVAVRSLQGPLGCEPQPHARRPRVGRAEVQVVAVLVGLATMERRALERQWAPIDPDEQHAARHVCGVEDVVRQRRRRILCARWPMHERWWAECRFAHRRCAECHMRPAAERHAPGGRELHEEVVRVLVIRDLKAAVRFALLKDRGVARLSHRQWLSTEHSRERENTAPEATCSHCHQPVLRSEVGLAAPSSLDVQRPEQRAVEMQTPCGSLRDVHVLSLLRLRPSVLDAVRVYRPPVRRDTPTPRPRRDNEGCGQRS